MNTSEQASSDDARPPWLEDIGEAACAMRELAQAQWQLLGAELRLARSAAWTLLTVMVCTVVFGVALGLTLLALLGIGLAHWLGSWVWALLVLAGLLAVGLGATILLFRRCLHWLSLPGTRAQWHAFAHQSGTTAAASEQSETQTERKETADEAASPTV